MLANYSRRVIGRPLQSCLKSRMANSPPQYLGLMGFVQFSSQSNTDAENAKKLRKEERKARNKERRARVGAAAKNAGANVKKYGPVFVATYGSLYVSTLAGMFVALDNGLFNAATFGMDPAAAVTKACDLIESLTGYADGPQYVRDNPRVGTFMLGWVMTKFTEPIRLGVTVLVVPRLSKWLGQSPSTGDAAPSEATEAAAREAKEDDDDDDEDDDDDDVKEKEKEKK